MAYRFLVAAIVGFWLVMTGLLVQVELNPQRSQVLAVPPNYVFGLMFLHGEESSLHVFDNGLPVGHLSLHPRAVPGKKLRVLEFSGNVSVKLPTANRQRLITNGRAELDPALRLRALQLEVTMRGAALLSARVLIDRQQRIQYEINQGGEVIRGQLNGGLPGDLPEGIDPAAVQTFRDNLASVTMAARRTEFKVRDEKTSAYLLTVSYGTTALAEIYVSELGQILLAKTAGGYTFSAEDESR